MAERFVSSFLVIFCSFFVMINGNLDDNDDLLSMLTNMKNMLSPENDVGNLIGKFLNQKDFQLDKMKQYVDAFSNFQKLMDGGSLSDLINNPLQLYSLMQHLVVDWKEIEDLLSNQQAEGESIKRISKLMGGSVVPSEEELNKAAQTVIRLQDVYDLNIGDIVKGKLGEINTGKSLTVGECLRLGQQALFNLDLDLALTWFEKGLNLASDKKNKSNKNIFKNMEHLKTIKTFLKSAFKLLTPEILKSLSTIPGIPTEIFHHLLDKNDVNNPETKMMNIYKQLCRGKQILTTEILSRLTCEFIPHDVTKELQRTKVEYLSYNPLVTLIHNVVSDKEIEKIKELSKPSLEEVKVHKYENNDEVKVSSVRTGKYAWLPSDSHPLVKNVYKRIEDFTGLSTEKAEPLHVVHYGIGGHYETHTDFFNLYSQKSKVITSDRVATVLLYLSDVATGGYTVFPHLGLAVKPEKGAALFWFNLLRSGEGDFRMIHAACPVLSASKWVANLWILEEDQIFHRPCALNRTE